MSRYARPGVVCRQTGQSKYQCPCETCTDFRVVLKAWNHRLLHEGLSVERGTSRYTTIEHHRRKNQVQEDRHTK